MGNVKKQFFFTLFVIPAIVAFFLFATIMSDYALKGIEIDEQVHDEIYNTRMLSSPDCFAYQDEDSGGVYTGYIDFNKFDDSHLASCLPFGITNERGIMVVLDPLKGPTTEIMSFDALSRVSRSNQVTYNVPINVVFPDGEISPGLISFIYWY